MEYPLSGSEELSKAYSYGRCRDCGNSITPMGDSSRCEICDDKFITYVNSGWGLETVIKERSQNQAIGLCFYCGNGLESLAEHLCNECQLQTKNGQWCRAQYRRGRQASSDRNPYINVWESNDTDNAVHLDATYSIIAEQMLSKAKYFKRKASRGGPRGREHLQDARAYIKIAAKMLKLEREIKSKSR